jgi:lipase
MTEPIFFIHGLFHVLFALNAPMHFAARPVLMPDLLGYGKNFDTPRGKISVTTQADYIESLLKATGYERAHFVAHSVGGAVAVVLARRHPHRVASLIDVEGNFTLKDAFWSQAIASMTDVEAKELLENYQTNPAGWLARSGIAPTPERTAIADRSLRMQPYTTLLAMARSVIEITASGIYLQDVEKILDKGIPVHLVAGENSRDSWDVPEFVLRRAVSMTVQPFVGHLMMLEDPASFLDIIEHCVS